MSYKKYSFLRNILAKRLKAKKREIEAIKAKNRFFINKSCCVVIDLSKVRKIELGKLTDVPDGYALCFESDRKFEYIKLSGEDYAREQFFIALKQLEQLRAYD